MAKFLLRLVVLAFSFWVTTLIIPAISVRSFAGEWWAVALSYVFLGLLFALLNTVVGFVVRIVALPLYILTLGLVSFLVNGFLFWLAAWVSQILPFGLRVPGFWSGVLGALVLSIISGILGLVFRISRPTRVA